MRRSAMVTSLISAIFAANVGAQTPKYYIPSATQLLSGADFTGDGVPDLVTTFINNIGIDNLDVRSGADGVVLHSITHSTSEVLRAVVSLGDTNGDGIADLAIHRETVACSNPACTSWLWTSDILVVYGGTWATTSFAMPAGFGKPDFISCVGDVDGDGHAEIAVAKYGGVSGGFCNGYNLIPLVVTTGVAHILSGADGHVVRTHLGTYGAGWPRRIGALGDADQDGFDDYAIFGNGIASFTYYTGGCGFFPSTAIFPGGAPTTLKTYSGATGAVMSSRSIPGGLIFASVGDADLDGIGDIAAIVYSYDAWPGLPPGSPHRMSCYRALWSAVGNGEAWSQFQVDVIPLSIDAAGQVDGLFAGDIFLTESTFPRPRLRCLSGFSGAERWSIYGRAESPFVELQYPTSPFPLSFASVLTLGDVDGDGAPEFALQNHDASVNNFWTTPAPGIYVYSTAALGVEERLPGCAPTGAPPTMNVRPAGLGFSTVVYGDGAPPYPAPGYLFASPAGVAQIPLGAGIIGPAPCTLDLDPSALIAFAPTISESQNALGIRGPASALPLPPNIAMSDNVVPGRWYVAFDVPNIPALVGFTLRLQAGFFPAGGGVAVSNSAQLTIVDASVVGIP